MRLLRRMVRASTLAAALIVLAVALTGCPSGSGDNPGGTGTPTPTRTVVPTLPAGEAPTVTLELAMRDIAYGTEELRAPAGAVFAIEFENTGVLEHDFTIEEFPGEASEVARGDPKRFDVYVLLGRKDSATLLLRVPAAGSITFWCNVPGHREVGMEGVLVIE